MDLMELIRKAASGGELDEREIEFVKILPKTFSGKIRRDLLRRHATTGENNWG